MGAGCGRSRCNCERTVTLSWKVYSKYEKRVTIKGYYGREAEHGRTYENRVKRRKPGRTAENRPNDIRYKHESDLTKKEKRELEKMKLSSMGLGGRLQYIWAYYKPQMAAVVAVIALAFFVKDMYQNSKIHTALTVMVIDSYGMKQEEAEEKVQEALEIQDDPYEVVTVDESLRTGEDGVALESYSQMAFTTKVAAGAMDVLIGSEDYMAGFQNKDEYFMDLTELLPEDVYQAFGEQEDKYSITITSDQLASDLEVAYEPIQIGILANSGNVENAVKWLTKLASELEPV